MHSPEKTEQPATYSSFDWIKSEKIDSLNVVVEQYRHRNTQASHYHIQSDSDENVFLVALRTVPEDSTGVAHVLEHTALCGSQKYPVRDPFFMMIRRSLNTFMNAFTSSDWTAYPFASKNRKDFHNLLQVYMDAVFFSSLNPLDFAQEGHRLEFENSSDMDSPLVRKGVVYNEMKGAMSSTTSALWQSVSKYLFPTTTYHHNSGGDPSCIPDLTYEQLKEFYETHYHPSNAIFMTFGDITACEHQEQFEKLALTEFDYLDSKIRVQQEKRYFSPLRVEESYPIQSDDLENKTHITLAWLLGESSDLYQSTVAHLISSILLENSAAPLRHALETSDLGLAPSPLCGLEESNKEMSFVCGLEGSNRESADDVEKMILEALNSVKEKGVDQTLVESSLHQLELSQREVGGDGYPYGLQLILTGLSAACHDGDPVEALNIDDVLERLRGEIKDPQFVPKNIEKLFLNNPHRVRLIFSPDPQLEKNRETYEREILDDLKSSLSQEEKKKIIKQTEALEARQNQIDDESVLPKVTRLDIPESMYIAEGKQVDLSGVKVHGYKQGTNGLVYQQLALPIPNLTKDELDVLPYFSACLPELGLGQSSYLDIQGRQTQYTGGLSAFTNIRGSADNEQKFTAHFILSSKALVNNFTQMQSLLKDTLHSPRFDESERIKELLAQIRARKEQSITSSGHVYAMRAAASTLSPVAALSHQQSGLLSIQTIGSLCSAIETKEGMEGFRQAFSSIHHKIINNGAELFLAAEPTKLDALMSDIDVNAFSAMKGNQSSLLTLPSIRSSTQQVWGANTQVNFCSKAYPTVSSAHEDAPALTVLGNVLRNGHLHKAIREQGGAYGAGASQDNNIAAFRFYSYRDPRVEGTLDDFDASIDWLLNDNISDQALEEAILGVIGSIDKPSSPAGEAKSSFHSYLAERTPEQRLKYRQSILKVTVDDLKQVTQKYLKEGQPSIAVLTNKSNVEAVVKVIPNASTFDV